MDKLIIGNLVNVSSGLIENNKGLLIKNGIIEEIVDEVDKVDNTEKYIIPGLIDSHLHLIFSGSSSPLKDFLDSDKEELYKLALKNAQLALEAGITTVRDCGSVSDVTFKLRDDINSGKVIGARILTSGEAITTRGGHIYFIGQEADTTEEMKMAAKKLIDQGADFIKLIISGGNMTPGSKDNVDQYSLQEIIDLTEFVHLLGKKVMAHVHTKVGMVKAIEAGVDYIEHGSWRVDEGIDIDYDFIKKMQEKGIIYCSALPKSYYTNFEKLHKNRVFATIKNMEYKDNVVLGTDGGTTNNSVKELIDQAIFLQEEGDFSNLDILKMMTLNPGKHILQGNLGEIKKGNIADFVVLNSNPLDDLKNLKDISAVYKNGVRL